MFYRDESLALFIDGANLNLAGKEIGLVVDFKLLLNEFMRRGRLIRASYYSLLLNEDEFSPFRPLVDWLDYNGFTTVTKSGREYIDSTGRRRTRGKLDVELSVDAMEIAEHVDHIVLFSGDGDFRALVAALQRKGTRVSVVSTRKCASPMVSDDLRRQADHFIELEDLRELIGRTVPERSVEKSGEVQP